MRPSARDREATDEDAVSDLVGFVLTFSLVVVMVGLVYTAGLGEVQTLRDAEHANNAERAFGVLDENIGDLVHGGAPGRATSVTLSGSGMQFGDPVRFNVTFADTNTTYIVRTDPIVYETEGGTSIVYSNGALIRDQAGGSYMVRDPPFVFGDRLLVPFIQTRGDDTTRGGQTTVLVRTLLADRSTFAARPNVSGDVYLTINSSRAGVWADYVTEESNGTCTVADGEATCVLSPPRAYVSLAKVDVYLI